MSIENNSFEKVKSPEKLLLLKRVENLKYLYLKNKLSMQFLAEDLHETLLFKYDGKKLTEILPPLIDEIKSKWQQIITEGKLPEESSEDQAIFSDQCEILLDKMEAVKVEIKMTQEDMEDIQEAVRSVVDTLDKLILLLNKNIQ